jgi:hypothetical protein
MTTKTHVKEDIPSVIPNGIKISISPKILAVIALLIGGGAGGITLGQLFGIDSSAIIENSKSQAIKSKFDFDSRFVKIDTTLSTHTEQIAEMDTQITEIQEVQHADIARTEARRITELIANREKRESEYDRLVAKNLIRLKEHKEPCGNLECTD